jgi:hypothetical protein
MAGWPMIGGRSAKDCWSVGHILPPFLISPLISPSLAQPPHLWDRMEGLCPHWLATRPPTLASQTPHGSPIKGLPRGVSSFIPQAHKQPQIS